NSYQDYEEAGCLMVVGADASANHPVIAVRFRRAVSRGARLIVVNPKRIELCEQAYLWIAQAPGTDVALFNAMARVIVDEGLAGERFIRERTEGFHAWRGALETYTLDGAERVTGVPARDIAQAARWYAQPPFSGSCLIWGMGITQHVNGIHNAHALLNLSLVAGQMGHPGSGISPLRGQNNVQGCGDAGCIPTNLPGYQHYVDETLARFEEAWGVRPRCRRRARRGPTGGSPRSSPGAWPVACGWTSAASSTTREPPRSSTRWRDSRRFSPASRTRGSIERAACSGRARRRTIPARATSM